MGAPPQRRYALARGKKVRVLQLPRRAQRGHHVAHRVVDAHQAALAVEDTTYYSAMVQSERLAAVGQTIATLSHHIKNILQGIRGGSYLVDMGLENEELAVVRKGWDIVNRNQNKISSLVMDMLSFSKEREPDPVPSDLVSLVADIVETVQQRAFERISKHVLLVDDNDVNLLVGESMLGHLGLTVSVARDGVEAVQSFLSARPDFILMDCQMPVMDGFAATRAMREDPRLRQVPVVALTAAVLPEERARCLESGMNDVLVKPVQRDALDETVTRLARSA